MVHNRRLKKAYRLLTGRKGFSLAELLLAVLILTLSTSILTATVALALSRYHKSTQLSAAQELCAALSSYVETELSHAKVTVEEDGKIKHDEDGKFVFNSDAHNFGPGAHFVIVDKSGIDHNVSETTLENNSGIYGRVCEQSILYHSPPYNIAGEGAYRGKNGSYEILAGMSIKFKDGAFKAHIQIVDGDGNILSENYILAVPIRVDMMAAH